MNPNLKQQIMGGGRWGGEAVRGGGIFFYKESKSKNQFRGGGGGKGVGYGGDGGARVSEFFTKNPNLK